MPAAAKKSTHQAFLELQADLTKTGIAKSEENRDQHYKYRGIDTLMNTLSPLLVKHKLIIAADVISSERSGRQTKNGGYALHTVLKVAFTIFGPDGNQLGPFHAEGECLDFSDKGTNKALGAAWKYWLFTTLCIPTEATADADSEQPEAGPEYQVPQQVPQQAPQQQPAQGNPVCGPNELQQIRRLLEETGTDEGMYVNWLQVGTLEQLPLVQFSHVMEQLGRKKTKMQREAQRTQQNQQAQQEAQQ